MTLRWQLHALDLPLNRVAKVVDFTSCEWLIGHNGPRGAIITGPATDPGLIAATADGAHLEIGYTDDTDGTWVTLSEAVVMESIRVTEGLTDTITIRAHTLEQWVTDRLSWREPDTDPSAWTVEPISTYVGAGPGISLAICFQFLNENVNSTASPLSGRELPWLIGADGDANYPPSPEPSFDGLTIRLRPVSATLTDCAAILNAGIWLLRTNDNTDREVVWRRGDRTDNDVSFPPQIIAKLTRRKTRPTATAIVIGDSASGASRTWRLVTDSTAAAAWGWIEKLVDAGDSAAGDGDELDRRGTAELAASAATGSVSIELNALAEDSADATLRRRIGRDWYVGDMGAVALPDGTVHVDIIGEARILLNADGATVTPVLGRTSSIPTPPTLNLERRVHVLEANR